MARIGLGRRGRIPDAGDTGDPLEGLVNLFDIGIVVAVAALIAALGATATRWNDPATTPQAPQPTTAPLAAPAPGAPQATGPGEPVGTVYRLPDGRLVYVRPRG